MKRLTEKDGTYKEYIVGEDLQTIEGIKTWENPLTHKLGQLEDIEEELGIDLITLFKALKDGVYYRNNQREINYAKNIRLSFAYKTLVVDRHIYKRLNDYGKTWALTKEELL